MFRKINYIFKFILGYILTTLRKKICLLIKIKNKKFGLNEKRVLNSVYIKNQLMS